MATQIVWDIRLPRTLGAWLAGALLGLSGAVAQGLFRNPLADPFLLGSASGASLGVALALVLAGSAASQAAFDGAWLARLGLTGAAIVGALTGLLPRTGQVHWQGDPADGWPARQRAQHIAWLGQNQTGGDDLTAYEVALLGRLPHRNWLAAPSQADHAAAEQALRATQAWDFRARLLSQLSGGERQRVLLARALAVQAPVLLMDEPLANLDPPHQADWLQLVRQLVAQGKTVVSVLHEVSMALQADDLLILNQGRLVHQGLCAAPTTHRALEAVFEQRISVQPVSLEGARRWVALMKPQSATVATEL